jgi:N-acetylgalactosamine-N,N'-diacetylbacillosaminyl-diphospho-undecaprenol 4-alpha-N-acetylgalactosaminyltransferase
VLFVCDTLGGGGAERFVATVLAHLDRGRVSPSLCLFRRDLTYGLPQDVPLDVLRKERPWHIPRVIAGLARLIDRRRPDAVFSAFAHPNFITGAALARARARPRWIARVSNDPERGESGAPRPLMRRLYRRAERILANSRALGDAFAAAYPALAGRVAHLPNAVDFERIDRLAAEPLTDASARGATVLAVGRLTRQKRIDLLLAAWKRLPAQPDAHLVLLGDGPLRADLERRAAALGLGERVHFQGFQANPYAWMARSDIFVLASDYEGLPNAMIEAQGLGLPAVATDCRYGPSEIVEPAKTGLLVPTGDADALARALESLLTRPERRRALGAAARERARSLYAAGPVVRALEEYLAGAAA